MIFPHYKILIFLSIYDSSPPRIRSESLGRLVGPSLGKFGSGRPLLSLRNPFNRIRLRVWIPVSA
jgi:hypothetical protein